MASSPELDTEIHVPIPVKYCPDLQLGGGQFRISRSLTHVLNPINYQGKNLYNKEANYFSGLPPLNIVLVEAAEMVTAAEELFDKKTADLISPGCYVIGEGNGHLNVLMNFQLTKSLSLPYAPSIIASGHIMGVDSQKDYKDWLGTEHNTQDRIDHIKLSSIAGKAAAEALTNYYQTSNQGYRLLLPIQNEFIDYYGQKVTKAVHDIFCVEKEHISFSTNFGILYTPQLEL